MKAMWASVDQSVGATSDAQVEKAIETFKQEHIRQVVQETLEGKRVRMCVALEEVVARVIAGQTTVEKEMPVLCASAEVKTVVEKTQEHQVLASEIHEAARYKLEDKARTTMLPKRAWKSPTAIRSWTLSAMIIASSGTWTECRARRSWKQRTVSRFWTVPPAYDFVQLRCYMFMKGKKDGVLLENFPGRGPRTTEVPWMTSSGRRFT